MTLEIDINLDERDIILNMLEEKKDEVESNLKDYLEYSDSDSHKEIIKALKDEINLYKKLINNIKYEIK